MQEEIKMRNIKTKNMVLGIIIGVVILTIVSCWYFCVFERQEENYLVIRIESVSLQNTTAEEKDIIFNCSLSQEEKTFLYNKNHRWSNEIHLDSPKDRQKYDFKIEAYFTNPDGDIFKFVGSQNCINGTLTFKNNKILIDINPELNGLYDMEENVLCLPGTVYDLTIYGDDGNVTIQMGIGRPPPE